VATTAQTRLAVMGVALAAAVWLSASAAAQSPSRIADRPDKGPAFAGLPVHDVATNGRRTVIGGAFTGAGPLTPGGAIVSSTSGALRQAPPLPGTQTSAVAAPDGGWYVGGYRWVRRITADGEIDPRFRLDIGRDPAITALDLSLDGSRLYVAGEMGVREADATTGELTAWRLDESAFRVTAAWGARLSPDGRRLFVAGAFSDGTRHPAVLAVDVDTGEIAAVGPEGAGRDIEISPDGSAVYVSGQGPGFTMYGIAALDPGDLALRWMTPTDSRAYGIVATTSHVFVSGEFRRIGGVERPHLARLDASTGAVADWAPSLVGGALALSSDERTLYVGAADPNGPEGMNGAFAVDTETAEFRTWVPGWVSGGWVRTITPSSNGGAMWLGGSFSSVYGRQRWHVAQMDETGAATWWYPHPVDYHPSVWQIQDVAIGSDGTTYVAYTWEFGFAPGGIIAVAPDGSERWRVEPAQPPSKLLLSAGGKTLYTNGGLAAFDRGGGRLAAFDTHDGSARAWSPHVNWRVDALAESLGGGAIYLGGGFTSVNGAPRGGFAAVDSTSGAVQALAADVDGAVRALAPTPDGTRVYLGGDFKTVAGAKRENLASISTVDGSATGFDPPAYGTVVTIAVSPDGTLVVVGGNFTMLDYQDRKFIAAFSADGELADWAPIAGNDWAGPYEENHVDEVVFSPDGKKLHVVGSVTSWGRGTDTFMPRPHYARFSVGPDAGPAPPLNQHVPAIVGTAAPGQWIECDPGHWLGNPTHYAYAWKLDGAPLAGEDGRAMLLDETMLEHSISCRVTGSNGALSSTAESAEVQVRNGGGPQQYPPPSWAEPVDPQPTETPEPTPEPKSEPTAQPTTSAATSPAQTPVGDIQQTGRSSALTAPFSVRITNLRRGLLLRRGARIQVTASRGGRYTLSLNARGRARPLARRTLSLVPLKTMTLRLRPTKSGRRWLRAAHRPRLRAVLHSTSGASIVASRFIALGR
jgi:hypothetical protein